MKKKTKSKILIVQVKKTFKRYRQFWYNGCRGEIFFVINFNKTEYKVIDWNVGNADKAGVTVNHDNDTCYFILKRHVNIIGKI